MARSYPAIDLAASGDEVFHPSYRMNCRSLQRTFLETRRQEKLGSPVSNSPN
jgi:hypothetical protein